MTPPTRARNQPGFLPRGVLASGVLFLLACGGDGGRDGSPPRAEFIVAAGDSTYWVRSDRSGVRIRGTPMVLARLDDRFRELYVVDDDHSFENALFVGQRLYQRDILSGDSTEVFRDTLIPSMAEIYQQAHPEARRLAPEEETGEEPANTATAEVSVIGVHGPYLSLEYHADTSGVGDDGWHMTKHIVIDLRTGKPVTLAEVLGPEEAASVLTRARALYRETVDSIRRDQRPAARRAVQSLGQFRFDPTSFSLTAPNGTLMIAFSAPGQGHGGEGGVLPMRPIAIAEPGWWVDARGALPTSTAEREEHWKRSTYTVKAVYDTASNPARLSLADSAGREFPIGPVNSPVHRIYWLDQPEITRVQRDALTKAFDEAALYDDAARASANAASGVRYAWVVRR
jgi:hypothetical protein